MPPGAHKRSAHICNPRIGRDAFGAASMVDCCYSRPVLVPRFRPLAGLVTAMLCAFSGCAATRSVNGERSAVRAGEPRIARVGGIVLKWVKGNKEANWRRAEPLICEAAARGAQIVVTTECFLDGYAIRDRSIPLDAWFNLAEQVPDGQYVRRLMSLADTLNIHLVAGMVEKVGTATFNTAIMIGPDGRLLGRYHKQRLGHEYPRNTPGAESPVFETPYGKVGLIICADRRDPEVVRRIAAHRPVLIICPSGGMWGPEKNDFHLQDRSRENHVPIVFVHPCEFLVTGVQGGILDRRFVGQELEVAPSRIGGPDDPHLVALYDVVLESCTDQAADRAGSQGR